MLFRTREYIGLSVGTEEMILVHVKQGRKKESGLGKIISLPVPEGAYADGVIADRKSLVHILAPLLKENRLKGVRASIAVNSRQAVIRSVRLPLMPEKELKQALEWEARRYIVLANNQFTMDYLKLGVIDVEGAIYQDLLIVAVKENVLNELCLFLKEAGLKILAIDVEPMAYLYLRSFAAARGVWPALEDTWASVELSAEKTTVAFYQRDTLQFVHTIPLAYNNDPYLMGDIFREVQRSFDYYHLNLKRPQTSNVYLWGKGAGQALASFQGGLTYPVTYLPLSSLTEVLNYSGEIDDSATLALGMALREVVL